MQGRIMILRRIAESVRARDWFTFTIEFAIVVAGVFIGIQVANWNAVRRASIRNPGKAATAREGRENLD
jgi:hypothetical protein